MSPDVDGIFRRFGYDPVRPVGRDDAVPDRLIDSLHHAPLVDEATLKQGRLRMSLEISPREVDCLRYVSRGLTVGMAAEAMGISVDTVRQHLKTARFKLQAKNSTAACCEAVRRGLIS